MGIGVPGGWLGDGDTGLGERDGDAGLWQRGWGLWGRGQGMGALQVGRGGGGDAGRVAGHWGAHGLGWAPSLPEAEERGGRWIVVGVLRAHGERAGDGGYWAQGRERGPEWACDGSGDTGSVEGTAGVLCVEG